MPSFSKVHINALLGPCAPLTQSVVMTMSTTKGINPVQFFLALSAATGSMLGMLLCYFSNPCIFLLCIGLYYLFTAGAEACCSSRYAVENVPADAYRKEISCEAATNASQLYGLFPFLSFF